MSSMASNTIPETKEVLEVNKNKDKLDGSGSKVKRFD